MLCGAQFVYENCKNDMKGEIFDISVPLDSELWVIFIFFYFRGL